MLYFDNAATSWPKPAGVIAEVERTMRYKGGNPSRGGHVLSMAAGGAVYRTRAALGSHFGAEPERVIFFPGASYALNAAMRCGIPSGSHFLISNFEHNAVRRTAIALERSGFHFDIFNALGSAEQVMESIRSKTHRNTKAIICLHASNVVPLILPIQEIGAYCREKGLLFIVDGAQSGGHIPIDIEKMNIDALCLPGHKGLLGPQGCGCMILSRRMAERMAQAEPMITGGSGIDSFSAEMPAVLPERFEAGTLPTPALAGLFAGVRTVQQAGYEAIMEREHGIYDYLRRGLLNLPSVTLYLPEVTKGNLLLFNYKERSAERAGEWFDKEGVCLRAGYHCAPLAHEAIGTPGGGALRIGIGVANTMAQAEKLMDMIYKGSKAGDM